MFWKIILIIYVVISLWAFLETIWFSQESAREIVDEVGESKVKESIRIGNTYHSRTKFDIALKRIFIMIRTFLICCVPILNILLLCGYLFVRDGAKARTKTVVKSNMNL